MARAQFAKDAGAHLSSGDWRAPERARNPVRADYEKMGKLLTALSKRTLDIGVQVGFHNHMGFLAERPEEVDWIFEGTDPRYAKLELDVAHCVQGGGDPVKMMTKYSDRLLFMHLKDVRSVTPSRRPRAHSCAEELSIRGTGPRARGFSSHFCGHEKN